MKKHLISSLALIGLMFLSACNIAGLAPLATGDSTSAVETTIALGIRGTQTAAALEVHPAGGATITPGELVPASVPMVSVSMATNCRTGPGEPYEIVGALGVGERAEVIGRNQSGDTWIIRLPSDPSVTCWLWGYYATVEGDTAGLTIYTPPPTPTPAAGFTVTYSYLVTCAGGNYAFRFQLTNIGTNTWQSYRVNVTDASTAESRSHQSNVFTDSPPGCIPGIPLLDLTPGESGGAGNWVTGRFDYDPTGHNITATFRLCTEDWLGGTCAERSITFTP
jgi:hypothetical protein